MKKRLIGIMAALVILLFAGAAVALAQESTTVVVFGVEVDLTLVDALVVFLGGGIVTTVTQLIKSKVKFFAEGPGAFLLAAILTAITTGVFLIVIHPLSPWSWITYLVYAAVVLGESTGLFHLYKKVAGVPTTS